jgi:hypothetical protein
MLTLGQLHIIAGKHLRLANQRGRNPIDGDPFLRIRARKPVDQTV